MKPFCRLLPSVAILVLFITGNALAFDSKDTPYHILASDRNRMDPDRVSLWPLAYHDSKATSIIWPLFSVSDDYLSAGLFYSQSGRRSVNGFSLLWPFCQIDLNKGTGWVLPFVWSDDSFALFPLLWHGRKYNVLFPLCGVKHRDCWSPYWRSTYWGALGLACCHTTNSGISDGWLFPLFYADTSTFLSLPYYHTEHGTSTHEGFCCSIIGWERHQGSLDALWTFPLFYYDEGRFLSLLGGYTPDASWITPLYYRDKDMFLTLPFATWRTGWTAGLVGATEDASWCFPFYYADDDDFFSPFFCRHDDADAHTSQITIPWLLGEYDSAADSSVSKWKFLIGLVGGETDAKGRSAHWLFPLYLTSGHGFGTLLFGHFVSEQDSTTWLATPLVSYHRGSISGSRIIPIYSYSRNCDLDDAERRMEATTLTDADFETVSVTNEAKQVQRVTRVRTGKRLTSDFYSLIGNRTRVLSDRADGLQSKWYYRTDTRYWNSYFLWKSTDGREVHFDVTTRCKTGERHVVSHNSLFFLYDHEESEDTINNTYTSCSSILWRLWRRHDKYGNVSMDIFPGFSRDTRTDGYSKTSFLWKLFNYESDPKKGDKLDLFFIPIL